MIQCFGPNAVDSFRRSLHCRRSIRLGVPSWPAYAQCGRLGGPNADRRIVRELLPIFGMDGMQMRAWCWKTTPLDRGGVMGRGAPIAILGKRFYPFLAMIRRIALPDEGLTTCSFRTTAALDKA